MKHDDIPTSYFAVMVGAIEYNSHKIIEMLLEEDTKDLGQKELIDMLMCIQCLRYKIFHSTEFTTFELKTIVTFLTTYIGLHERADRDHDHDFKPVLSELKDIKVFFEKAGGRVEGI